MSTQRILTRSSREIGRHVVQPLSITRTRCTNSVHHPQSLRRTTASIQINRQVGFIRAFHATRCASIDILESADHPREKAPSSKAGESGAINARSVELTEAEYHERADEYMEMLLSRLETLQEERGDIDVELSAGVLNVMAPGVGTYVLNKQPPNRQIWLSSPISGPKRFDWAVTGDGMHHKGETGGEGEWIYLRDGTSLSQLLKAELGVAADLPEGAH